MFKFLNLQPEIFGIDINDLTLRVVRLVKKSKGFVMVSFNEVVIPERVIKEGVIVDQEALVKVIKLACDTVKGKKLRTRYVAISLPEEKSFSQIIQMPKMAQEELRLAVPREAENYIPLAVEKVYLDFQVIDDHYDAKDAKENQNHLDLLINVVPKHIVESYVTCFKKAGLIPCILEVESQAIVRSLIKDQIGQAPTIFIDFGQTKTSFIIFSGNSIRFTSSIPISSRQLTQAIADSLHISFEKAESLKVKYGLITKSSDKANEMVDFMNPILCDLTDQIKSYIAFYQDHVTHESNFGNKKIEKVILCGGGANLKELPDFLNKKLKIPVELGDPFVNILPSRNNKSYLISDQKSLSFTTAIGLALRGANKKHLIF